MLGAVRYMTVWIVTTLAWLWVPQGVPPAAPPAAAIEPTAVLAGTVTRLDSDRPVEGAQVQVQGPIVPATGRPFTANVRTNAAGAYRLDKLAAGGYTVIVTADKFFPPDAMTTRPAGFGKRVDLADGQRVDKFDLTLVPAGAIEGHALDEFGDPAPGVTIQVAQLMPAVGKLRLMPSGGRFSAVTDDRGAFRVFGLAPGDYYLVGLSGPFGLSSANAMSVPTDTRAGFAPTYFPGTASPPDAKPVRIAVGHDTAGVTFAMVPSPLFTVSGAISDARGPGGAVSLQLLEMHGGDVRAIIPANGLAAPDGSFTFRNVPQGSYVLQARRPDAFGSAVLSVSDRDVTDVAIRLLPPMTARGRITFEGGTPPAKDRIILQVAPTDFVSGPVGGVRPPSVKVNDDFTFELPGLQNVGVLTGASPPGWQLLRATVDGEDITDKPYDFHSHDVGNVDVVMTDRWGSVRATVMDVNDQPAPDCAVIVFSQDSTKWKFPSRYVRGARANQQGVITMGLLPPGTYLVVAVPQSAAPGPEYDPALLESLRGAATRVVLTDRAQSTVTLKMIR